MIYSKIKTVLPWLIVEAIFLALTPQMFIYARTQRGYDAIGGELFFPFLPLLAWLIWGTIQDTFRNFKESEENSND